MGVHLDGSCNGSVSRLEMIEGPSGRRQRTEAERARIAAESLIPGMRVADIARKHGTTRWQIYNWRNKLRTGQLMVPVWAFAYGQPCAVALAVETRRRRAAHCCVSDGA